MKSLLFIVNPIAGPSSRKYEPKLISDFFEGKPYAITIKKTEYAGHGIEIAKQAIKDKIDVVIISGGDGSINEVGSALIGSNVTMGIIPSGSGNGLAHHLRIPIKVKKALEVIDTGIVQAIDAGKVENHLFGEKIFFSNCGFGYDAEVIHAYSKVKQRGFGTYLYFMVKSIFTLKPKQATIQFHEFNETIEPFVFTVANSSQYGYNIEVAPEAKISDGILDALLVKDASMLRVLKFSVLSMLKLRDQVLDVADFYKTKQISVDFLEKTKIQVDGEPFIAEGKTEISVIEGGLKVIIPSHF